MVGPQVLSGVQVGRDTVRLGICLSALLSQRLALDFPFAVNVFVMTKNEAQQAQTVVALIIIQVLQSYTVVKKTQPNNK